MKIMKCFAMRKIDPDLTDKLIKKPSCPSSLKSKGRVSNLTVPDSNKWQERKLPRFTRRLPSWDYSKYNKYKEEYMKAPKSNPYLHTFMYEKFSRKYIPEKHFKANNLSGALSINEIDEVNKTLNQLVPEFDFATKEKQRKCCFCSLWCFLQMIYIGLFVGNVIQTFSHWWLGLFLPIFFCQGCWNTAIVLKIYDKWLMNLHKNRVKNIIIALKPINKRIKRLGIKFQVPRYGAYIQLAVFERNLVPDNVSTDYKYSIESIEDTRLKEEAIKNIGKEAPIGYRNPYWKGIIKPLPSLSRNLYSSKTAENITSLVSISSKIQETVQNENQTSAFKGRKKILEKNGLKVRLCLSELDVSEIKINSYNVNQMVSSSQEEQKEEMRTSIFTSTTDTEVLDNHMVNNKCNFFDQEISKKRQIDLKKKKKKNYDQNS